jgi:hypothetical protein
MHDELNARDERDQVNRSRAPESVPAGDGRAAESRPMADREVPIELTRTPDLVHAWLDGEVPESALRGAEAARHVEFWKHLGSDLEVRRQMAAPADLVERIMEAIPTAVPQASAPWWNRSVSMNPLAIAAAAAGLLALGAAIGTTVRR